MKIKIAFALLTTIMLSCNSNKAEKDDSLIALEKQKIKVVDSLRILSDSAISNSKLVLDTTFDKTQKRLLQAKAEIENKISLLNSSKILKDNDGH